jgi:hypothetical protein
MEPVAVFRPRRARLVIYPAATALFLVLAGSAVLLPTGGVHPWGVGSRAGIVFVAAASVWFLHRLAAVRVETDEAGVTVVNILRRRRLEWAEIVGVRLLRDDPWLMLDLSDGEAMAAMGVQKSDGRYAQEQAQRFARMVVEHSHTPRND